MTSYFFIRCFFFCILGFCISCNLESTELSLEDFKFVGDKELTLLQGSESIPKILGKPFKDNISYLEMRGQFSRVFNDIYKGISIFYHYNRIDKIVLTGNNYKTLRGVTINDQENVIIEKYGTNFIKRKNGNNYEIVYILKNDSKNLDLFVSALELSFGIQNKKVNFIQMMVIYDSNKSLQYDDFAFLDNKNNRFRLMMKEDEVIKLLGAPIQKIEMPNKDGFTEFDKILFAYAGISFIFNKRSGLTIEINIDKGNFRTQRNITIGVSVTAVEKEYGTDYDSNFITGTNYLSFQFNNYPNYNEFKNLNDSSIYGFSLNFFVKDNNIQKIQLSLLKLSGY